MGSSITAPRHLLDVFERERIATHNEGTNPFSVFDEQADAIVLQLRIKDDLAAVIDRRPLRKIVIFRAFFHTGGKFSDQSDRFNSFRPFHKDPVLPAFESPDEGHLTVIVDVWILEVGELKFRVDVVC
jgi:hypothetical protein